MPQTPKTKEEILAILDHVRYPDRVFRLLDKGDGFLLQLEYQEEDIDTGEPELQKSRKHYISPFMTETEIVDTAFLCVMRSFEHIVREHFTYKGRRVQSPHFSIEARIALCDAGVYDGRLLPHVVDLTTSGRIQSDQPNISNKPATESERPCSSCGKPGHLPQDHKGWDPRDLEG